MDNPRNDKRYILVQGTRKHAFPLVLALGCVLLNLGSPRLRSAFADAPLGKSDEPQTVQSSPAPMPSYCGVHSLYRALRAVGKDIALADLIKPEYIGSKQGSTAEELEKAAKDLGVYAQPMRRMTIRMLEHTKLPIILHVKRNLGADKYDHWVLFMGVVDGKAKIYDGQQAHTLMPFDELAARWSRSGLVISKDPISSIPYQLGVVGPLLLWFGVAAIGVGIIRRLSEPCVTMQRGGWYGVATRTVAQAAGLLLIALVAMSAARISSRAGFLSYPSAIAAIQDSNFGAFLPKVSTRELANLLDKGTVAIVDARLPVDYQAGHLKGAISVPVTSNQQECQQAISHVPKESRIIVYSHSNGCDYGERVAKELIAQGYRNIWLFRGGWVEWERHYPPRHEVTQVAKKL